MSNNEWFERGELPPTGAECEYRLGQMDEWKWCRIVHNSGSASWIVTKSEDKIIRNDLAIFRHLKTERELAIDEIKSIIVSQGWLSSDGTVSGEIAKMIYDAGFRKV